MKRIPGEGSLRLSKRRFQQSEISYFRISTVSLRLVTVDHKHFVDCEKIDFIHHLASRSRSSPYFWLIFSSEAFSRR